MAGNLALVESFQKLDFLPSKQQTMQRGKLFIWLPIEEPYKNIIQSVLTVESVGIHWKTKSSYSCRIADEPFLRNSKTKYTLMIFFLITPFLRHNSACRLLFTLKKGKRLMLSCQCLPSLLRGYLESSRFRNKQICTEGS